VCLSEGAYPTKESLSRDFTVISQKDIDECPRDVFGNPLLAKLNLASKIAKELKKREDLKKFFGECDSNYEVRDVVLDGAEVTGRIKQMIQEAAEEQLALCAPAEQPSQLWNLENLNLYLKKTFGFTLDYSKDQLHAMQHEALKKDVYEKALAAYEARFKEFSDRDVDFNEMQRVLLLQIIDHIWKNHLYELDHLKKGVGLRAYGQKDPLIEYQKESYGMFEKMLSRVRDQMVEYVFRIQLPPVVRARPPAAQPEGAQPEKGAPQQVKPAEKKQPEKYANLKVGRNDPCPCGSGKKYKKCHGK